MSKSKALCLTAISLIAVLQLIAFTECQSDNLLLFFFNVYDD